MVRFLLLGMVLILFASAPSFGADETLVPIDLHGKCDRIDARTENKIRLFPEYRDFREARLFQTADSSFVLEISHGAEGKLTRTRVPMNFGEVEELRLRVTEAIAVAAPQALLDQEGRTKLLIGTTLLSLQFYGWACPVVVQADGAEAVGLYMLTAGGTMILPILLTRERDVTDAAATLSLYGATRGIVHGILLESLLHDGDADGRAQTGMGWAASMAEGIAGFLIADDARMTRGHAEMIGAGGDAGALIGTGAVVLSEAKDAPGSSLVLAGSGFGMYGGHLLGKNGRFTRGDSYVFRGTGTLGALLGVTITSAFDPKDNEEDIYTASAMAGGVLGLAYGAALAGRTSLTGAEGILVNVGGLGGGLLGLGAMVLVTGADEADRALPYLLASSAGACAGFAMAYHAVAPGSDTAGSVSPWSLDLLPALAAGHGAGRGADRGRAAAGSLDVALSLRISRRF